MITLSMNHDYAKQIFEEIRARPYGVGYRVGEISDNCYYKGLDLLQRLGAMGYTVRGRIGEIDWRETPMPEEVLALIPVGMDSTHFYVEVLLGEEWRILDTSFQPRLAKYGFTIGGWDEGVSCFRITKLYSLEENVAYHAKWEDPVLLAAEFESAGPFLKAVNEWFGARR